MKADYAPGLLSQGHEVVVDKMSRAVAGAPARTRSIMRLPVTGNSGWRL